ncbi:MAG: hypothetical protein WB681_13855 [Candidatus Cybelea sp.]
MPTIADSYGQASDAAAVEAATGSIVVANILGPGFVVVCTRPAFRAPSLHLAPPVSAKLRALRWMRQACYADSYNAAFTAVELTYWAGCSGTGTALSGFLNTGYGGVDIDNKGNIATLNWHGSAGADLSRRRRVLSRRRRSPPVLHASAETDPAKSSVLTVFRRRIP